MTGAFDHLETPLVEEPLFPVEAPDGRKDLSELDRQSLFVAFMRRACPHMTVVAIPNAAKRGFKAQRQVKREGLMTGAFDTLITWDIEHARLDCPATMAMIEWKGFTAAGRPGELTQAQIDFGNQLHRQGHKVACFFSARTAIEWLKSLGAPIRGTMQ